MRISFDPRAKDDLDRIFAWIAKENPGSAYEMIGRIETRIKQLATRGLAHIGRPGLVEGTRELIERPYIVVYKVDEHRNELIVLAIMPGAQDR
jgi:toxin ParE1/3/4